MAKGDPGDDVVPPVPRCGPVDQNVHPYLVGFDPEATLSQPPELPRPPIRIPIVLALSALGALVCSIVAVDHSERLGYLLYIRRAPRPIPAVVPSISPVTTSAAAEDIPPPGLTPSAVRGTEFSLTLALNSYVEANRAFTAVPALTTTDPPERGKIMLAERAPLHSHKAVAQRRARPRPTRHLARLNFWQRLHASGYRYAASHRQNRIALVDSVSLNSRSASTR